ncbi:MAG: hypothetical protein ACK47B_02625 [Armatimonadota bacterium]
MRVWSVLAVLLIAGCASAAWAGKPRIGWEGSPSAPRLRLGEATLLETLAQPSYSASLWKLDGGALAWDHRGSVDTFAIRQTGERARDVVYAGDVRIVEGDVAGLVLRASAEGPECFAVLLGAQSKTLRIVYLPWPGRDLQVTPFPVEPGRAYRLEVTCRDTGDGVRLAVSVDGIPVTEHLETRYRPGGSHLGVMCNNSRARFDRLTAREGGPAGRRLFQDEFEAGGLQAYASVGEPFQVSRAGSVLTLSARLPAEGAGFGAIAQLRHGFEAPEQLWVPHVTPEPGFVIADHSLRSPALVFADRRAALVVVPDVDDLRRLQEAGLRTWLDYDHPTRTITAAVGQYRVGGFHVGYQPTTLAYRGQEPRLRLHVLTSTKAEDLANPYRLASAFLWERWGRPGYLRGGSQRAPISTYNRYITRWAFEREPRGWGDTVWQQLDLNGRKAGGPAFIVDVAQHPSVPLDQRKWREQRSIWNQAWFSTQRSANGLLRYARRVGSKELEARAREMTAVALAAPQKDGLFPAVLTAGGGGYSLYKDTPGWEKARWTNSDRRPAEASAEAVHLLDAAFTARLLLEWSDLVEGAERREARGYVERFADRAVKLQRPSGAFPGWIEPDGREAATLREGPESAMVVTLLLELLQRTPGRADYREAALRGLRYLAAGPVREARWEDFETYFSCSRWWSDRVGQKIPRTGVYKSNTFSPFWCAEAFLAGHRALRDPQWLALGQRCLDELSLYQQVWDPPTLPAPCHGGFGVMNADGEWNDARQSLFAPLYLEYHRETGRAEYFERGASALRASFAMLFCPENSQVYEAYRKTFPFFGPESYGFMMENIAHGGPGGNPIGPFTIYTWGNGAALASAAAIYDRYGDVLLDPKRKQAFGIDGCRAEVRGGQVEITDPYGRNEVTVAFAGGERKTVRLEAGRARIPLSR